MMVHCARTHAWVVCLGGQEGAWGVWMVWPGG